MQAINRTPFPCSTRHGSTRVHRVQHSPARGSQTHLRTFCLRFSHPFAGERFWAAVDSSRWHRSVLRNSETIRKKNDNKRVDNCAPTNRTDQPQWWCFIINPAVVAVPVLSVRYSPWDRLNPALNPATEKPGLLRPRRRSLQSEVRAQHANVADYWLPLRSHRQRTFSSLSHSLWAFLSGATPGYCLSNDQRLKDSANDNGKLKRQVVCSRMIPGLVEQAKPTNL